MRVLAIDPGEKVGWAHAEMQDELEITGHGVTALKPFALKLFGSIMNYDVVIYETFRLTAHGAKVMVGSDLQTAQMVGMIRLLSWLPLGPAELVPQSPKNKVTALEKLIPAHYPELQTVLDGLPKAHDESHDGDAIAHLAFYHFKHYR